MDDENEAEAQADVTTHADKGGHVLTAVRARSLVAGQGR